ncbi:GSCFA domain-containing protein [Litoribacter populi]|uniref:GSCFA domain-containing protein n=1 Tax=Litoribacter populi TaxID=2598460 RepID=UPI00117E45B3|nr:GSCFA domain-containing protein [Litoribacter populi]
MNFRITFPIPIFPVPVSHSHKVLSVGSCFANMLGKKLSERKYQILSNPFGIIFNPVSLFQLLHHSLLGNQLEPSLLLEASGNYMHYQTHSDLRADSKESLNQLIGEKLQRSAEFLKLSKHLFITLGTSYVYEHLVTGQVVANCHKQPASLFKKRMLELEEMNKAFDGFYSSLKEINPEIQIILTVSPVRHIKDGVSENQVSKSLLRVFTHQLTERYQDVNYFPSFELMMDDLRDYRFYQQDLLHPTAMAEDYIWGKFEETFLREDESKLNHMITSIQKDLLHKPFNPSSEAHQKFLNRLLQKIDQLPKNLDFSAEKQQIHNQLTNHEES